MELELATAIQNYANTVFTAIAGMTVVVGAAVAGFLVIKR